MPLPEFLEVPVQQQDVIESDKRGWIGVQVISMSRARAVMLTVT